MTRKRLLLARLLLCVAPVAACELALRWFHPIHYMEPVSRHARETTDWSKLVHRPSAVPGLAYELNPGFHGVTRDMEIRINSLGLRGAEPLAPDTAGLFRIAALGDSVTFGFGVLEEETFGERIEQQLDASPLGGPERRFEVLNFGVSGYSTRDEVAQYAGKGRGFHPRLVILGYTLNDPEIDPTQPLPAHFLEPRWWQHFHLLRLVAGAANQARIRQAGDYFRSLHWPTGRKWKSVTEAFARLAAMAREDGVPVLLVLFPMAVQSSWSEYPWEDLHEQVRAAAEASGFLFLDLLGALKAHALPDVQLGVGDMHPNALGNAVAAEEIVRFLLENRERWLPSSQ